MAHVRADVHHAKQDRTEYQQQGRKQDRERESGQCVNRRDGRHTQTPSGDQRRKPGDCPSRSQSRAPHSVEGERCALDDLDEIRPLHLHEHLPAQPGLQARHVATRSAKGQYVVRMRPIFVALGVALGVFGTLGCGEDERIEQGLGASGGADGSSNLPASFSTRGSVEQVFVTHGKEGGDLELIDGAGAKVASGTTDEQGSLIFRNVAPGNGYVVRTTTSPIEESEPVEVLSFDSSTPDSSFYGSQKLSAGFQYLTMRDGIELSAYITLPGPPEDGPYPTVVNYSGYDPSKPGEPLGTYESLCGLLPVLCDAPSDPSALIAALMGYATIGVNMRGTGCSGGAYDFFEPLQLTDGYDVIEIAAAQSWVKDHRVGMTGLSYPGISQLFVAKMHPPSLAAITPLSVIGNTATTLVPGGILNNGFALNWATNVLDKADPYGQGWEQARVDGGDSLCEENQLLHSQKIDIIQKALDNPYYDPEVVGPLNPSEFVGQIDVPVFLAGAWEDEQTGPFFFALLDKFVGSPLARFTVYNGIHPDGFAPQVLVEWKNFLDFYVAKQIPSIDPTVRTLSPALFNEIFGTSLDLPPDRFASYTSYDQALADYEKEPALRVIFENGGEATPGAPVGTFETSFDSWPPSTTTPQRWYFQPDGSLADTEPTATDSASRFALDPEAGQRGILAPGGDVWDLLPDYDWKPLTSGDAVAFVSEPLTSDLVMIGTGSVDLWVRANVDDADLEVNLTEVRPDGQEMYVQSGWLRASQEKLAAAATELWPEHTHEKVDVVLLDPGTWTAVRVGIAGFEHVFRTGSRIRLSVDTPGDSRAEWRFQLKTFDTAATYDVAHDAQHPSSVVLPIIPGIPVPTPFSACPSLRGQQCRAYVPLTNQSAN